MNKDVSQEKLFMSRVTPSAEYFVDNNNHSATAAFFTCYICPQQLPNHAQQQQLALSHVLLGRLISELLSNIRRAGFSAKLAEHSASCATSGDSSQQFRASISGAKQAH
ncbi:hypothetical protein E4U48_006672 [Claviceps purpurea]|nr:hypothetical protein E4U48_006672 [Claviceps purpurea]